MLYSIESGQITRIPHEAEFRIWRSRLTDQQYEAIVEELNSRIQGKEVETSSWIPGADWTGTVFEPIYYQACAQDFDASRKFFGIIVWKVFMDHPERWSFGRYDVDGIPIKGMTYFRIGDSNLGV